MHQSFQPQRPLSLPLPYPTPLCPLLPLNPPPSKDIEGGGGCRISRTKPHAKQSVYGGGGGPINNLFYLMKSLSLVLLAVLLGAVFCADKEEWRKRSIYQLLTDRFARNDGQQYGCDNLGDYCGGGYRGIINNLDYIQGMGFDAIWISPIIDNRDGGYHGYWGRDIYKLNDRFGSEQDFIDFVSACHERNILVMVDVVGNHMGNLDTNYGVNNPFKDASHYHDWCEISDQDFANHNQDRIQNCRLAKLADLKQENDYVRTTLLSWIRDMINKYHIDGIRIDTIPEVPKWFWSQFSQASGVYTVGEVFDGAMWYLGGYLGSLDGVLNYPFFFWVRDTLFNQKDMYNMRNYYTEWGKNIDMNRLNYMANFCDNHDNARTLSWGGNWEDKKKHHRACHAMAMTSVGIPIVYYGAEQYFAGGNDPANREILWRNLNRGSDMYIFIGQINAARKRFQIWGQAQVERYVDNEFYAYSRGKMFVALTNKVSGTVSKTISYHPFSNGEVICNIFYPSTDCITVNGQFSVYLLNGEVKIYVPR